MSWLFEIDLFEENSQNSFHEIELFLFHSGQLYDANQRDREKERKKMNMIILRTRPMARKHAIQ